MDRIKAALRDWAHWHLHREGGGGPGGYPSQSAFATERVQNSNRSTDTYAEAQMPPDLLILDRYIERLAPSHKRIVAAEYLDRRPQKAKAEMLRLSRQAFSAQLRWIHEQLDFLMYGG
ncbi:MAG: hypothetical protein ACJ72N_07575 [Labedaea sp.]|jgi:hypothetical protein